MQPPTSSIETNQHIMKHLTTSILLILIVFFITSCTKETPKTFSINGSISPADLDYIVLQKETDIERKITEVVGTIKVDTKGNFNTSFTTEPYLYSLVFPNKKSVRLAIQKNQDLTVTLQRYNTENMVVKVAGSKDATALLAYEKFREASLDRLVKSVRREITALKKVENPDAEKIAELGQLEIDNYEVHLNELNNFIKNNMNSTLGLYATSIRWKGAENLPLFDSLATAYEAANPNLEISKRLREKVTRLQQTAIGGTAKNIKIPNAAGNIVELASIKSNYILVDFWASWCGPCRRESAGLNEIHSTYSREDFDIYGVALDDDREKWLAAIEKDNRIWTNVSTLERFKTTAAFDYAVTALPDNYLIDSTRKIVAKNVHGEELEVILNKLLRK